jgi:hypothetical protein
LITGQEVADETGQQAHDKPGQPHDPQQPIEQQRQTDLICDDTDIVNP